MKIKKALDYIIVEILGKTKTKAGILLTEKSSLRLNDQYTEVKVLKIGAAIPKDHLGNDEEGYLEVGDTGVVDVYCQGIRDLKLVVDGVEYGMVRPFEIVAVI